MFMSSTSVKMSKIKAFIFLKDVLIIAFTAFGGPNMHLALYSKIFVEKRNYLSQEELLEIYSFCQFLPGPSSTQTITAIAYRKSGTGLAIATLLIWIFPAFLLMSAFSFLFIHQQGNFLHYLRFLNPIAVSIVIYSALKMGKAALKNKLHYILAAFGFVSAALLRRPIENYFELKTPWIFPVVLVLAGIVSYYASPKVKKLPEVLKSIKIPWKVFLLFVFIFIGAAIVGKTTDLKLIKLFENTIRFGTLVFGGGQVLIPMMLEQFVQFKGYLTAEAFISGYGLVQAIPGPIFSFTAYIGGLIMAPEGTTQQWLGCLVATIGIFLPGTLILFFVLPIWDQIKKTSWVKRSLPGVIAASVGLVIAASYLMFLAISFNWKEPQNFFYTNLVENNAVNFINISIIAFGLLILLKTRIPSPVLIVVSVVLGFIL